MSLNESIIEDAVLEWFEELGYATSHGPMLAPDEPATERDSFTDLLLIARQREAIRHLHPAMPKEVHATIQRFKFGWGGV
ncbi:type I restriction enzyme R subunit [Desulfomicrobium macestii]|uniref:Type I restriction enzyme, R subunit n=2 Tax=Desulfomicrobium TaxID=898 RepID=A0A8G2C6A7_DESNO|nr:MULTISPECIES: hypothetical protein [Desulfomicrobium]MBE1426471.1 type I restriction enzyme R subunit [Desulfomicrobium macestii]SFM23373.1 type I restriction enzyme, R subunit [Desulfomicrobium norvegicum]